MTGTVITVGALAHQEMIEEMDRELAKAIEDFDRIVDVEALCLAKKSGRDSSSQFATEPSSIIPFRARSFAWET